MNAATYRAVVSKLAFSPLTISQLPRPTATSGSVVVRDLASTVVSYMRDVLTGKRPYPLTYPSTPVGSAVGRIEEIGPDATSLKPGQLVLVNVTITGGDDPSVTILLGLHGGGYPAATLFHSGLVMVDRMRYSTGRANGYRSYAWRYSHRRSYDRGWGSAAVMTALAMGATVIAAGRNTEVFERLSVVFKDSGRSRTVALTGDVAIDSVAIKQAVPDSKGADAFIDFSPPGSTHITVSLAALRPFGRCVFMGGIMGDISISYSQILFQCLRIQGRFMYNRKHALQLISMAESGILKVGEAAGVSDVRTFGLDDIDKALEEAEKFAGWGTQVVLEPQVE